MQSMCPSVHCWQTPSFHFARAIDHAYHISKARHLQINIADLIPGIVWNAAVSCIAWLDSTCWRPVTAPWHDDPGLAMKCCQQWKLQPSRSRRIIPGQWCWNSYRLQQVNMWDHTYPCLGSDTKSTEFACMYQAVDRSCTTSKMLPNTCSHAYTRNSAIIALSPISILVSVRGLLFHDLSSSGLFGGWGWSTSTRRTWRACNESTH